MIEGENLRMAAKSSSNSRGNRVAHCNGGSYIKKPRPSLLERAHQGGGWMKEEKGSVSFFQNSPLRKKEKKRR